MIRINRESSVGAWGWGARGTLLENLVYNSVVGKEVRKAFLRRDAM